MGSSDKPRFANRMKAKGTSGIPSEAQWSPYFLSGITNHEGQLHRPSAHFRTNVARAELTCTSQNAESSLAESVKELKITVNVDVKSHEAVL